MSCQKLQMWQPTSLYGFRLKGMMGTKQNVNLNVGRWSASVMNLGDELGVRGRGSVGRGD